MTDSPVVGLAFLAFSASLGHLLLYEGWVCDAVGALIDGDATWVNGEQYLPHTVHLGPRTRASSTGAVQGGKPYGVMAPFHWAR